MKNLSYLILGLFITSSASAGWSCASICKIGSLNREFRTVFVSSYDYSMTDAYKSLYRDCLVEARDEPFELAPVTLACIKE